MYKRVFFAACLLCAAGLAVAQAYKWVDENGVVHYSDRPQPGAEEIVLPDSNRATRITPRRANPGSAPDTATEEQTEPEAYTSLEVVSPSAEETLWNIQGTLDVRLNVQPGLKEGHQVRVYFDGEPRMVNGTTFTIPEVFRGVHNIQAEIVDSTGQLQIRSETNRFYVQQTSVVGSNRPNAFPR